MMTATSAQDRLDRISRLFDTTWWSYCDYRATNEGKWGRTVWEHVYEIDEESVSYGDLQSDDCPESADDYLAGLSTDKTEPGPLYFTPPYFGGSDYSGSTVSKANADSFLESFGETGFVWPAYGGHNTWDVVVGLTGLLKCDEETFDSIMEVLEGLEDYPCIDDEAVSRVESENADEAWKGWASSDFTRALEKAHNVEFIWPDDDTLRALFDKCAEKANCYWENQGSGPDMWIDVARIVGKVTFDDIVNYAIRYVVRWVDVGAESEEFTDETQAADLVDRLRRDGFIGVTYTAVIGENDKRVDDDE